LHAFFGDMQQQVQAHTVDTGHRSHRFTSLFTFEYEDRVDQIVHAQGMFAHQAAGEVITAKAARAA
jgi:hypothetical protein